MVNYTHPGVTINVVAAPTDTAVVNTETPLHRPLFLGFAPKGPIGVPMLNDMSGHSRTFGTDLFSTTSDYANTIGFDYINLAARSQEFYFLRLPDNSDTLGCAVFAIAKTVTAAPVYQAGAAAGVDFTSVSKDATGATITKDQTQYTLVTYPISTNNPLTVAAVCKFFGLDPKTASDSLYLLMYVLGTTHGNYMTRNAFSLDVETPLTDDATLTNRIGAPLIRFYPRYCTDDSYSYLATQMNGTNYSFSTVENAYSSSYVEFCPTQESVVDTTTNVDYGWEPIIKGAYTSLSKGYLLDYDIHVNVNGGTPMDQRGSVFNGTFALALRMYNDLNMSLGAITTPIDVESITQEHYNAVKKVNPFSGKDLNSVNYLLQPLGSTVPTNSTLVQFGKYCNIFNYDDAAIGQAKDVTDYNIDLAVKDYFDINTGQLDTISDAFAITFNQIYDTGYTFATKQALANILDIRDDVKIDWSTETFMGTQIPNADKLPKWMKRNNVIRTPNDYGTTLSSLMTLSNITTTHGIDDKYSTQSYRGEIYCQAITIASYGNRKVLVPSNYERLKQRLAFYRSATVTGSPKGRPNNEVSSAISISWVPQSEDQKQVLWSRYANYVTYADSNTLYIPDIRTCYPDENSILSSGVYTDHIDQYKHIVRDRWTYYTGLETPVARLVTSIQNDIDTEAHLTFGNYLTTKTTVEIMDSNTANNYTARINTMVIGDMPDRIWEVVFTAIDSAHVPSSTNN